VPIDKVITYITAQGRLLLFRQPQAPNAGLQVPGGSVERGESLEHAALREAFEETGLSELRLERFLGTAHYVTQHPPGVEHLRHFFHLSCERAEPAAWRHFETTPTGETRPIPFELFWEPLETARPDWEMDRYLALLSSRSGRQGP
jgi:ADP-ribose pyrophosphatase YjhB (NUDIX family)